MGVDNFITQNKKSIRKQILELRDQQKDKELLSQKIMEKVFTLGEFDRANTVLIYLDIKSEVRTRPQLSKLLSLGKIIAVPFVTRLGLDLFHLEDLKELEEGSYGILEPSSELRKNSNKIIAPDEIELALVPGVAFDPAGSRLGYGKGYYDNLLADLSSDCLMIGLGFECQIRPKLPQEEHDICLDKVITENKIYE